MTRALTSLLMPLSDAVNVRVLGFVPEGSRPPEPAQPQPSVVLVPHRGWLFQLNPAALTAHVHDFAPHDIFVMSPPFLMGNLLTALAERGSSRLVVYLPIEGEPTDPYLLDKLSLVDLCIVYTRFVKDRLEALAQTLHRPLPRMEVLGHGVDTTTFVGLPNRDTVKSELFSPYFDVRDAFIVLNGNRAYPRKRLDITIEGFARFARRAPNAYLYLHILGLPASAAKELHAQIATTGVESRIFVNLLNPDGAVLPECTLNRLYNACDVGVTTSMGEGWGLGSFEHAATGAPQIVPDHTGFAENWRGSAALLPPIGRKHVFYESSDMFVVSPDDLAAALERIASDTAYRTRLSDAALRRAHDPALSWRRLSQTLARHLGIETADVA